MPVSYHFTAFTRFNEFLQTPFEQIIYFYFSLNIVDAHSLI